MKLMIGLMMMVSVSAFAEDTLKLTCGVGAAGAVLYLKDNYYLQSEIGFNYSSARLNCNYSALYRFKEGESFSCAGIWESEDTVAVAHFRKTEQGWKARFRTSKYYGQKEVEVVCQEIP